MGLQISRLMRHTCTNILTKPNTAAVNVNLTEPQCALRGTTHSTLALPPHISRPKVPPTHPAGWIVATVEFLWR